MPCNCSHLHPHDYEVEMSKVQCILEELMDGKPIDKRHFSGYHPSVYSKQITREYCDVWTSRLCRLMGNHKDVSSLSLEAQVWWRDHQEADRKREEKERLDNKDDNHP